jgi:hypothetical protein
MVRMSVLADCLKTISNAEKRRRRQVLHPTSRQRLSSSSFNVCSGAVRSRTGSDVFFVLVVVMVC